MRAEVERRLEQEGLRRVKELNEILSCAFIVDTYLSSDHISETKRGTRVYPVLKDRNLTHDLLNLYGTHWRYRIDPEDWENVSREDKDRAKVLENMRFGIKEQRFSAYPFTQKNVNMFGSLWVFQEETPGWAYRNRVLVPRLTEDMAEYRSDKKAAKAHFASKSRVSI